MGDTMPSEEPIVVSPEEKRFLARFFRRQLLLWAGILLGVPVVATWWLADPDGGAREARTAAAIAQVRTENQALRAELAALNDRLDAGASSDRGGDELERRVEDARQSVRMIEARVTAALERRIDSLETQVSARQDAGSDAPPPEAAAWDVSAILDRLYALEMRDGGSVSEHRVSELEERIAQLEMPLDSLPAAPARD